MFGLYKRIKKLEAANKSFALEEARLMREKEKLEKQVWNLKAKLQKVEDALK